VPPHWLELVTEPAVSIAIKSVRTESLRGNAFIPVVQTAELRDLDDSPDTRPGEEMAIAW
jgi:hypothetical protein